MIIIPSRADNTLCFLNGYMFFCFQCWHLVLGPCKPRIFAVEIPRLLAAMVVATAEKRCTATSERRRYPWASQSGQVSTEICKLIKSWHFIIFFEVPFVTKKLRNCPIWRGLAGERVHEVFSESCVNPNQMFHTSSASPMCHPFVFQWPRPLRAMYALSQASSA